MAVSHVQQRTGNLNGEIDGVPWAEIGGVHVAAVEAR